MAQSGEKLVNVNISDNNNFERLKYLGNGSFGHVYLVKNKQTGQIMAEKELIGSEEDMEGKKKEFLSEIEVMSTLHYPTLLSLHSISLGIPYRMYTEYLENGSLQRYIDMAYRKKEPSIWDSTHKYIALLGIALGIKYLHSKRISHRDLKPLNVLLDSNLYPRICDFGMSKTIQSSNQHSAVGTQGFCAPEVFMSDEGYDPFKADIFSFGMIMHCVLYDTPLFAGARPERVAMMIMQNKRPELTDKVLPEINQLIARCWDQEPNGRPTIDQIVDIFLSPQFPLNDVDQNQVSAFLAYCGETPHNQAPNPKPEGPTISEPPLKPESPPIDENAAPLTIVIDNGSQMTKAGFVGDEAPLSVFPTFYGRHRNMHDTYIGDEALTRQTLLYERNYPISNGVVTNWDNMESIWYHTFYKELRVDPSEQSVLLIEAAKNPKSNRETMVQIMFETFNVQSLTVSIPGFLSIFGAGRETGLSVEIGEGVCQIVPVYDGKILRSSIKRNNMAGHVLTERMIDLLTTSRTFIPRTFADHEVVRDIKERKCYVALDYKAECFHDSDEILYELPDGQVISIGKERFKCPELLFQPIFGDRYADLDGIHQTINSCIQNCSSAIRNDLYQNIVLSGGSTLFPGLPERLKEEVQKLAPSSPVNIIDLHPFDRRYLTWIGGSALAEQNFFSRQMISHDAYDSEGPSIIDRIL